MGAHTDYAIASWQGISPATGGTADILRRMSDTAFELIKIIELEKSGIRDGDGFWHGSDALGGTARDLVAIIDEFLRHDVDGGYFKPSPVPADDNLVPF
jgi:hypothetical protein